MMASSSRVDGSTRKDAGADPVLSTRRKDEADEVNEADGVQHHTRGSGVNKGEMRD